jgi:ATP-binding cassette subfamily C protein
VAISGVDEQPRQDSLIGDARELVVAAWHLDHTRFALQLVMLIVSGLVGGASLLLLVPIVNSVADPTATIDVPILGTVGLSSFPLWSLLAIFIVLVILQAGLSRSSAINSAVLQQRLVDSLRQQAFGAILAARWSFVLSLRRSDIVQVVTIGATRAGMAFQQLMTASVAFILSLATAAVALLVSPGVAALAIVAVVIVAIIQGTSVKPAYQLGRMFSDRSRHLQSVITDSMDSLRLVRAHDASSIWAERLSEAFTDAREVQLANTQRTTTISAVSSVGMAVAAALLVLISVAAGVTPTSIVVILVLIARLNSQVQRLVSTIANLANALPAVRDMSELILAATDAVEVPEGSSTSREVLGVDPTVPILEFRQVTFHYAGTANGVSNLTMVVPTGDITALTGPSGAGKSTAADLALGLLEPQSGTVIVDGTELTAGDLAWWRRHIAYVPQETVLVPGTLRDNLAWSVKRPVSDDECWAALDRAAAVFARSLPLGLDSQLGDRGLRLSGGERQRIAIARALLRQPTLLVLDEATSSLDNATESAVLEMMTSLVPAMTVLVVAHRQSTIDAAHHVVRLNDGRIAA